ncbi:MAG: hypothetical protein IPL71_11930 [Anaerolineales bacterium]|uniref:hypothetical protein n=1 Tax=Candidatus Villigracilis proximus TaxID=3140683 RepID=UPI003136904E|nr:hypothetical protein [Anaerolineales bacterium]
MSLWTCLPAYIPMRRSPYLSSFLFLLITLLLSLAVGSIFIPPAELWRALTGVNQQRNFSHDPVGYSPAAHGLDRIGGCGIIWKRRGVSGTVPQSAG